jgi:hypothetical protein
MGVPSEPAKGEIPVAAVKMRFLPTGSFLSSWRKERKLALSASLIALQPMPWLLGYSQLIENMGIGRWIKWKMDVLKVDTVEIVLGYETQDALHKSGAVLSTSNICRVVNRSTPATDGYKRMNVVLVRRVNECGDGRLIGVVQAEGVNIGGGFTDGVILVSSRMRDAEERTQRNT